MKVIANIATKGNRSKQLRSTINSLMGQVDQLNVYDNSKNKVDYTDNAKFYYLQFQKEPVYYLTADDDIIYPPNYVEKLIYFIERYGCIISFHGRILKETAKTYYSGHEVYDFRQVCPNPKIVAVGGTGVMGFRTDYFNPIHLYKSKYKCMSDLVFALEAKNQEKSIIMATHEAHWLRQQVVEGGIMKSQIPTNQENQIKLANQIMEL